MARYRIGNDMTILWTVNGRDGSALPLKDKEAHLYYTCERGRFEAEFEIQGTNVVAWNFLGKNQRALGDYTLSLEILQSDGKRTIKMDKCNAFSLVGRNCEEVYNDGDADINEGGELAIVSNLDIYRISPIIPYVVKDKNGIGYWYVDGVKTGDRSTGESAYEYALTKGFDGTEEEFAALMAKLPNVSAELAELSEGIESLLKITLQDGYYLGANYTTVIYQSDSSLSCAKIGCREGERFIVTGTGTLNANVWYTLDKEGTIIRRGGAAGLNNFEVIVESSEAFFVFNSFKSYPHGLLHYQSLQNISDEVKEVADEIKEIANEVRNAEEYPIEFLNTGFVLLLGSGALTGGLPTSRYSDFIPLDGVKSFRVKSNFLTTSVATVAYYDEDKNFISGIGDHTNEAIVDTFPDNAAYARISITGSEGTTYAYMSTTKDRLVNSVDELMSLLQFEGSEEYILENKIDNSFVDYSGAVNSNDKFAISQEIQVKKGDLLRVQASATQIIAAIAKIDGAKYTSVLKGPIAANKTTYVLIKEDSTIVASFEKSSLWQSKITLWRSATLGSIYSGTNLATSVDAGASIIEDESSYNISFNGDIWKTVIDFTIDTNVNENKDNIVLAKVGGHEISIVSKATNPLVSRYVNDDESYVQELQFNSGYQISNTPIIMEAKSWKPLVGVPAMMLWLKGYVSTEEPTAEEISSRASWLENNQDYSLVVDNDTLSIVRDGIGYDGSSFNNGATSVIFTTSIANKTLGELFTELSGLDYLNVELMDLSANKTCADLLQFGKVKLVGRYKQQLNRASSDMTYSFDSYPFPLRFAVDESTHTLEIVSNGNAVYCAIDGRCVELSIQASGLQINKCGDISIKNIIAEPNNENVIIANGGIVSPHSPRLLGLMGHATFDTYEGSGVISDDVSQSVTRIEDLCLALKNKGYYVMSLDEVARAMQTSLRQMPLRSCFFVYDDMPITYLYKNYKIRNHVARYGFPMNFAIIQDATSFEEVKDLVLPMRLNGWCCASHSLKHDVPLPNKNSIIFRWELNEIRRKADECYFIPNILVYNWSGQWEPLYNMLYMCGYIAAINSTGIGSRIATNPYLLGRANIADKTSFAAINSSIL